VSTQELLKKDVQYSFLMKRIKQLEEDNLFMRKELQDQKNINIASLLDTNYDTGDVQMFSHRISCLTATNFALVAEKNGFVKNVFLTKIINQALKNFI
jgi:hypothetical protein